ncbi:uncharacterized protein LOC131675724 isoform X2 [Phymastichus coffea]|uniref:uncharacterized protein LOC131675724 isoform X2 n=1 Tax=Phymastichus coffea TaxID=108790 RepID=UPI00273A8517|nr:uncharacterized protein LOC131675724 isoform X2 [Phymastichus coffea]
MVNETLFGKATSRTRSQGSLGRKSGVVSSEQQWDTASGNERWCGARDAPTNELVIERVHGDERAPEQSAWASVRRASATSGKRIGCTHDRTMARDASLCLCLMLFVATQLPGGSGTEMNEIFGEEEQPAKSTQSLCPGGADGLECRRAEARRSVDCPRGDCYCYNCSRAGPELWASCCRESLKCCSHLAAACRTCDQPPLHPFCAKHFKKCLSQLNDKKPLLP